MATTMTTLTGSEKQVAWAEKIRTEKLEMGKIQSAFKQLWEEKDSANNKPLNGISQADFKAVCIAAMNTLKSAAAASFWIDAREQATNELVWNTVTGILSMRAGGHAAWGDLETVIHQAGVL